MIRIRVSFDNKNEVKEAKKVTKIIARSLKNQYQVSVNRKIYWNLRDKKQGKEDYGGRIYMTLKPKTSDS